MAKKKSHKKVAATKKRPTTAKKASKKVAKASKKLVSKKVVKKTSKKVSKKTSVTKTPAKAAAIANKKASKKAVAKVTSAKKTSAKKTPAAKTPVKKMPVKKTPTKKVITKQVAAKAPTKRPVTGKATNKKTSPAKLVSKAPESVVDKPVVMDIPVAEVAPAPKRVKALTPPLQSLDQRLRAWLGESKKIVLDWDCGGDETIIHGKIDDEVWNFDDSDFQTLCDILIEELQLPNVGEEFNEGGGTIGLKDDRLVLSYDATYIGGGWDEENEESIEEPPEKRQGDLVLM